MTTHRSIHPRQHRWAPRLLAAAALALCAPVWAAGTGSFSSGPITFQLIDLRPDDGIAPSVSFQVQLGMEGGVAAEASQLFPLQLELHAQYAPWTDSRLSAATDLAKAKARVHGGSDSVLGGGAMMSGNGSAKDFTGPQTAATGFLAQAMLSSNGEPIRLTLSPWTALVATLDASVKLATTHAASAADATAELSLSLDGQNEHRDGLHFECSGSCNLAEARTLNVTIQNESDAFVGGAWWAQATVQGSAGSTSASAPLRKGSVDRRTGVRAKPRLGASGPASWLVAPR